MFVLAVVAGVLLLLSLHVLSWVLSAWLAGRRGRRPWAWFCVAVLFGWFAALFLLAFGGSAKKTCPQCAEKVNTQARVCRYCGANLESIPTPDETGWANAVRFSGVVVAGSLVLLIIGVVVGAATSRSAASPRTTVSTSVSTRTPEQQRVPVSAPTKFSINVPRYDLNNRASFGFQESYVLPPRTQLVLTVHVVNGCHAHSFGVRARSGSAPDASLTVVGNGGRFVKDRAGGHSTNWDNTAEPAGTDPFRVSIRVANRRVHLSRHVWVEYSGCYPS
jgi:hypothetical protein